jgi:uncharacterized protein (DUF305 family)
MTDQTIEFIEALQRQQREAMEQQQKLMLQTIKDWSETVRVATATSSASAPTMLPNQADMIAAFARFGEQLMASHQEFIGTMVKLHQPTPPAG